MVKTTHRTLKETDTAEKVAASRLRGGYEIKQITHGFCICILNRLQNLTGFPGYVCRTGAVQDYWDT